MDIDHFWRTVLSPQQFIPHGHCYLWNPELVWLHLLSDVLIAIAYYSIPLMLLYFVRQRQNIPFKRVFILFSAFIITCGTTHVMDIWTLWHPAYWLAGAIKALTALVSVYTALELYPVIPQALALPDPTKLQAMNQALEIEIGERKLAEANLKAQRDFNQLIAEVTSQFVDLASEELDAEIERILQLVGEFTQTEFSYVFKFSGQYNSMSMTHEWCAPGCPSYRAQVQNIPWEAFPWSNRLHREKQVVHVPQVANLPPEAAVDQMGWQRFNLASLLAIPLIQHNIVTGFIGFASFSREITWPEEAIRTLGIVSRTVANVQERSQAEERLRESEARFRQVVESIQEVFFIRDFPSLTLRYVSPMIESVTGFTPEELYDDFDLFFDHIHSADRDRIVTQLSSITPESNVPIDLEFRFNRRDASLCWIQSKLFPVKTKTGEIYRLIGAASDITAQKSSEAERLQNQKLRLELGLLERILDIILAGYWDWDIPNHREYLSVGFKRMFGYEDNELPNSPESWQRLIFPEDLPEVMRCFEQHVQSHGAIPYYNEVRYHHKDGSTVWVICSGQVIEWDAEGNPLRMIGCHVDITRRKLAEEKLRQQALIFDNISDGIIITDLDGRIGDWNAAAETMFGYTRAEVLGRSPNLLHHPADANTLTQRILDGVHRQGQWQGEISIIRKDGTVGICETIVVPLQDSQGQVIATLGVNRDISDRKARERELQASLAEKEVLLQEIHHRVKNNLQIVSSLLNLQATRSQNQHLSIILTESQNRVRSMALLHEKLYRSPDLSKIHVGDYIQDLTRTLLRSYRHYSVNVDLDVEIGDIFLTIDVAMPCGLIVNELVSNSLKYAFSGKREGTVAIAMAQQPNQTLILTVEDNGIGLPDTIDLHQTQSLGLQMVCALTQQLSGTIAVARTHGTQYRLQFPSCLG